MSVDTVIELQGQFGYECVRVQPSRSLGVGSYGSVCRATLDQLPCAAKVLHTTFFGTHDPGQVNFAARFEQECAFLSNLKHPCIVQFLGLVREPQNLRPILLMELMDESLTKFLEHAASPLAYHVQVGLVHDTALALAYLHSNRIVHRDLSSNNILLLAGCRAKVTDFGMSRIVDVNPRMTPLTQCPGTPAFMAPEALLASPTYSDKLDVFSTGVLIIQIVTRRFPTPKESKKMMEFPASPTGFIEVPVSEIERRQADINRIAAAHPLLPLALDCIKDKERQRPSAAQLCQRLAALKEASAYAESVQGKQDEGRASLEEKERENAELREQLEQNEEQLQETVQQLAESQDTVRAKEHQIDAHQQQLREKHQQLQGKDRQLQEKNRQIDASRHQLRHKDRQLQEKGTRIDTVERENFMLKEAGRRLREMKDAELQSVRREVVDLQQLLAHFQRLDLQTPQEAATSPPHSEPHPTAQQNTVEEEVAAVQGKQGASTSAVGRFIGRIRKGFQTAETHEKKTESSRLPQSSPRQQRKIVLKWETRSEAPCTMGRRGGAAVASGNVAYFNYAGPNVLAYHMDEDKWTRLQNCTREWFGFAVINSLLTAVGGEKNPSRKPTNTLTSLREGNWVELLPPMSTNRVLPAVVTTEDNNYVIVAGGKPNFVAKTWLATVEVLNCSSLQWTSVCDMPEPLSIIAATICNDRIYCFDWRYAAYTCTVDSLLSSSQSLTVDTHTDSQTTSPQIWRVLPDVPAGYSTPASLCGQLVAVGGEGISTIHQYNMTSGSWEAIGSMPTARCGSLVVVLPGDRMLVVCGMVDYVNVYTVELGVLC